MQIGNVPVVQQLLKQGVTTSAVDHRARGVLALACMSVRFQGQVDQAACMTVDCFCREILQCYIK